MKSFSKTIFPLPFSLVLVFLVFNLIEIVNQGTNRGIFIPSLILKNTCFSLHLHKRCVLRCEAATEKEDTSVSLPCTALYNTLHRESTFDNFFNFQNTLFTKFLQSWYQYTFHTDCKQTVLHFGFCVHVLYLTIIVYILKDHTCGQLLNWEEVVKVFFKIFSSESLHQDLGILVLYGQWIKVKA